MSRAEGWERRLADLIGAAPSIPFQWGARDCCLWAADAVQALLLRDPAAAWRGTYSDRDGALRTLRAALGGELHPSRYIEAMAERIALEIGASEVEHVYARRGDIALLDGEEFGRGLGVIDLSGRHIVVVRRDGAGLGPIGRVSATAGVRFWAVG